jgi:hypothetical protein
MLSALTIGDSGWTSMVDGLARDFPVAFDRRGCGRVLLSLPRLRGLFGIALEQIRRIFPPPFSWIPLRTKALVPFERYDVVM